MISIKRHWDNWDKLEAGAQALLDAYLDLLRTLVTVAGEMAGGDGEALRASLREVLRDLGPQPAREAIASSRARTEQVLLALAESLARREVEFREIIRLLARAGATLAQTGVAHGEELRRQAAKIEAIARLESLSEVRQQLQAGVAELNALATRAQEEGAVQARRLTEELDQARANLQYASALASTDALTGLGNRRLAESAVEQALAEKVPVSVLMLDMNGFKIVNDKYGHSQGDSLLRSVGYHIRRSVRDSDLVCRWGGDEFLVVMRQPDPGSAQATAARILSEGFGEFVIARLGNSENVTIAASIGVAEAQPGDTAHSLLDRADLDMYAEKRRAKSSAAGAGR